LLGNRKIPNRTIDSVINRTYDGTHQNSQHLTMTQLTANDLKVRGIAAIESVLTDHTEATISVRGKDRFVVMDMAQYHYLRECELEAAMMQSKADIAAGRAVQENAQDHMARLDALLNDTTAH
jgi:PHD/YefM family antitoxin component YafN of YafNO toxin-antitoxin module